MAPSASPVRHCPERPITALSHSRGDVSLAPYAGPVTTREEQAAPDALSTRIGRLILLLVGATAAAFIGADMLIALADARERGKPGAYWFGLIMVAGLMGQAAAMTVAVVRDRRVGDTTGGLGVVALGIVLVNLFLLCSMGAFSPIP